MGLMGNRREELDPQDHWGNFLIMALTVGRPFSFRLGFIQCLDEVLPVYQSKECFSAFGTSFSISFSLTGKNITLECFICLGDMMLPWW